MARRRTVKGVEVEVYLLALRVVGNGELLLYAFVEEEERENTVREFAQNEGYPGDAMTDDFEKVTDWILEETPHDLDMAIEVLEV